VSSESEGQNDSDLKEEEAKIIINKAKKNVDEKETSLKMISPIKPQTSTTTNHNTTHNEDNHHREILSSKHK
jgi:hypothetical protein